MPCVSTKAAASPHGSSQSTRQQRCLKSPASSPSPAGLLLCAQAHDTSFQQAKAEFQHSLSLQRSIGLHCSAEGTTWRISVAHAWHPRRNMQGGWLEPANRSTHAVLSKGVCPIQLRFGEDHTWRMIFSGSAAQSSLLVYQALRALQHPCSPPLQITDVDEAMSAPLASSRCGWGHVSGPQMN